MNSYQLDSREGVVPGLYVKQLKDYILDRLNTIEDILDNIESLL